MKSLCSRFVVLLGICVFVVHAHLSENPSASAMPAGTSVRPPATQTTGMKPTQPAQAIQTLTRALAGSWRTSETYERTEPTPNGGTGEGEAVWRQGPGGFTLLEEYQSKTPLGDLSASASSGGIRSKTCSTSGASTSIRLVVKCFPVRPCLVRNGTARRSCSIRRSSLVERSSNGTRRFPTSQKRLMLSPSIWVTRVQR
jgi:hypothetical protein